MVIVSARRSPGSLGAPATPAHVGRDLLRRGRGPALIHAQDCADCETKEGMLDRIDSDIELSGALSVEQRAKLLEIAKKCPIHRTLTSEIEVRTQLT